MVKTVFRQLCRGRALRGLFCLALLWCCAACIPSQTPPQLTFTPGAPVTVTDRIYRNEHFSVAYPQGWRVITAPAEASGSVIFAGDKALIVISSFPIEQAPDLPDVENQQIEKRTVSINGQPLYAALVADTTTFSTTLPLFESLLTTVSPP